MTQILRQRSIIKLQDTCVRVVKKRHRMRTNPTLVDCHAKPAAAAPQQLTPGVVQTHGRRRASHLPTRRRACARAPHTAPAQYDHRTQLLARDVQPVLWRMVELYTIACLVAKVAPQVQDRPGVCYKSGITTAAKVVGPVRPSYMPAPDTVHTRRPPSGRTRVPQLLPRSIACSQTQLQARNAHT